MSVAALVLAAGRGSRLGEAIPKAFVRLAGRTLLERSACALAAARGVDAIQPVVPAGCELDELADLARRWQAPARWLEPATGGDTRQASVSRGLEAARAALPDLEWVLVHDAARPFVEAADGDLVLEAAQRTGAAVPVILVGDTIKQVEGERVVRTLERRSLRAVQTPQAFRVTLLREALAKAEGDGFVATDCSGLVERLGVEVRICAGRSENFKLTRPEDRLRAEAWLAHRTEGS